MVAGCGRHLAGEPAWLRRHWDEHSKLFQESVTSMPSQFVMSHTIGIIFWCFFGLVMQVGGRESK